LEETELNLFETVEAQEAPEVVVEEAEAEALEEPKEEAPEAVEEPEPEVAVEAAEEPKKDSFASKFAALSRKEKKLLDKGRQIKEFEAKLNGQKSQLDEYDNFKNLAKSNPLEAMKLAGIDYQDVTHRILNKGERSTRQVESELRNELNKLREEQSSYRARVEEMRVANEVNKYIANVNDFIDNNNEKYDLLSSKEARDRVMQTADRYATETGEIPDIPEVCDFVESELKKEAASLYASDSFLKKMGLVRANSSATQGKGGQAKTPKTLTNSLTPASDTVSDEESLTEEERLEKSASMLVFE
jgi:hypothetical protein